MKYYAAVLSEREFAAPCVIPPFCILASFHYFRTKAQFLKTMIHQQVDLFVDSGAFSAANSKKEIKIDDYCKFVIESEAILYAGLDVVGDAKATRYNMEYMKGEFGLKPIPTFHMGSTLDDLEKLMDYSYIALGGMVFGSDIRDHCDAVWQYILKNNPKIKVHGFGLTNLELMERYPWHSVDSSSYKSCKRYGRQNILWNGFNFKTFSEDEYIELLKKQGHKMDETMTNIDRWFLYDFYSVQSYKTYGSHLLAVNKIKDFSYLTAQQTLFS